MLATAKTAPATPSATPTVEETALLLQKLSIGFPDNKAAFEAQLSATLKLKAADYPFWQQVAAYSNQKFGKQSVSYALQFLPKPLQNVVSLALLGGEQKLTYDAFLNQLAFISYSNAPDLSDVKQIPANAQGSTRENAQAILSTAGYHAMPTVQGLWGFQMRVFKPIPGKAKYKETVVAFRGTEGIAFNPKAIAPPTASKESQAANESGMDTMTDLAEYATAYSQYEANAKLIIDPLLKGLGSNLVATGHSLGGGLAQIAVAKHAAQFSEVFTYQAANIKQADVDRLDKRNPALKATQFRAVGGVPDQVPSSGETAITGNIVEVNRKASGAGLTQNQNAAGGHNSPVALEMLREMNAGGLVGKANTLAQTLIKSGSQDNANLVGGSASLRLGNTYPTSLDTTPGKEALKQKAVAGNYRPQFISTYQNNAIYNILAERALPVLREIGAGLSPQRLVDRLQETAQGMIAAPVQHTESSRLMLKVIFGDDDVQARRECESLNFDSKIIGENGRRFQQDIIKFWYSVHLDAETQYLEAKNLWPRDPS